MTQNYWYIKAKTTEELESAPIFKVRVGKSKSDLHKLAEISAAALVDDSIFFCVNSDESHSFVMKLQRQNENRAFYDVTISQLKKIMNTTANVVHVENLSERVKANRDYMLREIRGSKILNL